MATSLFNIRVDDDLQDAIDACAKALGVKKSVWAREVLGAVALGGVTMEQLTLLVASNGEQAKSPHPERFLTIQAQTARRELLSKTCSHPLPARKHMPFTVVCSLCGDVVKRT
jgi:predicted transcriptional regulator